MMADVVGVPMLVMEVAAPRQKWMGEMANLRVVAALVGGFALSKFNPKDTETNAHLLSTILLFMAFHAGTCSAILSCVLFERLNFSSNKDPMPPDWVLNSPRLTTCMSVLLYCSAVTAWGWANSEGAMSVYYLGIGICCPCIISMIVYFARNIKKPPD
mmetsp:Transcript_38188/g.101068  ORF Transcript_38188/g.101068 Transcript_38188/m.101068 type:complete len:158 (+) Transcript_38188:3-476(+)